MNKLLKNIFYPFGFLDKKTKILLFVIQISLLCIWLEFTKHDTIPKPSDIFISLYKLVTSEIFYDNLVSSIIFITKGLFYSIFTTMFLSYLWTIEFFKPIVDTIIKFRYLTFGCVIFLFTQMVDTLDQLKMVLLLFGVIPFFTTSFVGVISQVLEEQKELNKSYINRNNKWETLYEVIIVGKLDDLILVIKQNSAIAWSMITAVEGYTIGGGGIGTLIIKQNRKLLISEVFALAIVIIVFGICFDKTFSFLRFFFFKYIKNNKK